MSTYIIISDTHISGLNPVCRLDNLVELQFKKLKEVVSAANDLDCPIIHLGDFFDHPSIGYAVYTRVVKILNLLSVPMLVIYGNHDYWFHNPNTYKSTPLYALIHACQNVIGPGEINVADYINWNSELITNDSQTLLCHRAIIENPIKWGKDEDSMLWNNKILKSYRLILNGHWHRRNIFEKNKQLFIRPGSLTRREANNDSLLTFPSYILLQNREPSVIPLKCAKSPEEVISKDHLELSKTKKNILQSVTNFINQLKILNKKSDVKKFRYILSNLIHESNLSEQEIELINEVFIKVLGRNIYEQDNKTKTITGNSRKVRISTKQDEPIESRKRFLLKTAK